MPFSFWLSIYAIRYHYKLPHICVTRMKKAFTSFFTTKRGHSSDVNKAFALGLRTIGIGNSAVVCISTSVLSLSLYTGKFRSLTENLSMLPLISLRFWKAYFISRQGFVKTVGGNVCIWSQNNMMCPEINSTFNPIYHQRLSTNFETLHCRFSESATSAFSHGSFL